MPIDTLTSFKTEIVMTLLKGGVPGVQNYLNVINTFVDADTANNIAIASAFIIDFNNIIGIFGQSIVATQQVIVLLLQAAGLPVDITALTDAELADLSGVQGLVTTTTGKVINGYKGLVSSLEQLTSKAAAPVDKAIFNAVVGGSAMFNSSMKNLLPAKTGAVGGSGDSSNILFSVFKSTFKLQNQISLDGIGKSFANANVDSKIMDQVQGAGTTFLTQIDQAKDFAGLTNAKAAFESVLLGKPGTTPNGSIIAMLTTAAMDLLQAAEADVNAIIDPLKKNLATALGGTSLNNTSIIAAFGTCDTGA
jgi:hypothetical protein